MIISMYIIINIILFLILSKSSRIEETQSYLNMLQGKLINEKKNICQHQEIQIIPMSYPYVSFTQWDKILRK